MKSFIFQTNFVEINYLLIIQEISLLQLKALITPICMIWLLNIINKVYTTRANLKNDKSSCALSPTHPGRVKGPCWLELRNNRHDDTFDKLDHFYSQYFINWIKFIFNEHHGLAYCTTVIRICLIWRFFYQSRLLRLGCWWLYTYIVAVSPICNKNNC